MSFTEEVKKYVDKGVDVSKEALSKAGAAVQKLGDESVIRLEKLQFENQVKEDTSKLGQLVYKTFCEDGRESISVTDVQIALLLNEMKKLKDEIATREKLLKKDDKKA